jgi:(p)ppGpp synthase/HD superfamily hydrolase
MRTGVSGNRFAGSPTVQAALAFASARHAGQCREVDGAPFIAHPIEVARLLRRDRHADHVVAAGLLHDVLEKTATTGAELDRRFGLRIARLVTTVSDDLSIESYEERKRDLRTRVERADSGALAVFAADKVAKVREQALSPRRGPDDADTQAKLAHYGASLEMLRRVAGELGLVNCLEREFARLMAPVRVELTATRTVRPARALVAPARRAHAS